MEDLYDKNLRTAHYVLDARPGGIWTSEDGTEYDSHVFTVHEREVDNDEPTGADWQELQQSNPDEVDVAHAEYLWSVWDYSDEVARFDVQACVRYETAKEAALAFMRALEEHYGEPEEAEQYRPGISCF